MPHHHIRHHTPRPEQPHQRHLERENRRLRKPRLPETRPTRDLLPHLSRKQRQHLVPHGREHRKRGGQPTTHPHPLRTLTREHERHPRVGGLDRHRRTQPGDQLIAGAPHGGRAPRQRRATGGQRRRRLDDAVRLGGQQPGDLLAHGGLGLSGHHPRHDPFRLRRDRRGVGGLLEHDVGIGAADPEGGHARAAGARLPRLVLGGQCDGSRRPVDVAGGDVGVQRAREDAVAHGLDGFDHPGDARGGLGVADVGLHRAQPGRAGAVLAVRGKHGPGLDRVAEGCSGAVGLDDVHIGGPESGVGQRGADDPLLRRTVGRGQAVGRAVLVDRRPAQHRENRVAETSRVGEPGQQEQTDTLTEPGTVGGVGERLAPPVRGQTALPGELDEQPRGGQHSHPARECQIALSRAQRASGQVDRHERGRAGGVHGDRRALQAEGVGDPAGGDTGRPAGAHQALQVGGNLVQAGGVVMVHEAREHPGTGAPHAARVNARAFERLPGGLQQQPLLRVGGQGLARRDTEEVRVESGGVVQERALPDGEGAGPLVGRVERSLEVPASVGGKARHGVAALGDQRPQVLGAPHATGEAAGHGDDRDRLVGLPPGSRLGRLGGSGGRRVQAVREQVGERRGRRVVEHHRRGQALAGGRGQPVAQLHGGQGVEAEVAKRSAGVDPVGGVVAEDGGDLCADHVEHGGAALPAGQPAEPGRGRLSGTPACRADEAAQQRVYVGVGGAHGREVEADGDQQRFVGGERRVEQGEALLVGEGPHATPVHAREVAVTEMPGHTAGALPQPPGQRDTGQPGGPATGNHGVDGGVRGAVGTLARVSEEVGRGGEDDEGGEIEVAGRLVEHPDGAGLRGGHGGGPLGRDRLQHAVVEYARGVDDGRDGVFGQQVPDLSGVGDVAGHDRDIGVEIRCRTAGAAGEHEPPHAVRLDQVPCDETAEDAGAAGDQHSGVRTERRDGAVGGGPGGSSGGASQAGGGGGAVADADPGLVGAHRLVAVHDREPAGMLGGGGADQARDRGEVRVVAVEQCDQPGVGVESVAQDRQHGGRTRVSDPPYDVPAAVQRGHDVAVGHGIRYRCGGDRRPVETVEISDRCAGGVAKGAEGEFGGQHRGTGRVDGGDRDGVRARRGEADTQRGGCRGVTLGMLPGEGQPCRVPIGEQPAERGGVQGGVQQRRVHAEPLGPHRLRQPHLGQHGGTVALDAVEAPERGAVVDPARTEVGVEVVQRHVVAVRPLDRAVVRTGPELADRADGVPGPRCVLVGSRVDGHGPGAVVGGSADGDLELDSPHWRQHQRGLQGQVEHRRGADLVGGVQREVEQGRSGHDGPALDDVVAQPRMMVGGDAPGEHGAVTGGEDDSGAEQGVAARADPQRGRIARRSTRGPVGALLKGVGGQVDVGGGRQERAEIDLGAVSVQPGCGAQQLLAAVSVAAQGSGDEHAVPGALLDADGEHRVRADLDEGVDTVGEQRTHGIVEADGAAQVVEPVLGAERGAVLGAAGQGGPQGDRTGARTDRGQHVEQFGTQILDLSGVRGVVHRDALGTCPVGLAAGEQLVQGVRLAGDDHGGRPVDRSHGHPVTERADPGPHRVLVGGDRHHAAAAGEPVQHPRPQRDDPRRVLEGQRPRDARGRDLALRVTDDGDGVEPALQPEVCQRDHDREQHRLHDLDPVETLAGAEHLAGVEPGVRRESVGALGEPCAEHRVVQQVDGHARPLRTLSGKHQRDSPAVGRGTPRARGRLVARGHLVQSGEQLGRGVADDDGAVVERRPGLGQRAGHHRGLPAVGPHRLGERGRLCP